MAASGSMDLARKGCSDHGIALLTGEVVSYLHKLQRKTLGSAAFFYVGVNPGFERCERFVLCLLAGTSSGHPGKPLA
jgi:hypothetical protein